MGALFSIVRTRAGALMRRWAAAALLLAAAFAATPADAQYARLGFGQFQHSRWTADDGAPTGIGDIAQTPDGWIWLASTEGLFRFDGISFERVPAPTGSPMERAGVRSLFVSRSGELWVGFSQNGGVAVYRGGQLQDTHLPQPPSAISHFAQTRDGAILAAWGNGYDDKRLFRWSKGRWEWVDQSLGFQPGFAGSFCRTADGTIWFTSGTASSEDRLLYLPPGGSRIQTSPYRIAQRATCADDRQGRLWIRDTSGVRLVMGSDGKQLPPQSLLPPVPGFPFAPLTFDAAGGMWQATGAGGVYYTPDPTKPLDATENLARGFAAADGLSADITYSVFVDRENNVWVGSELGVDRFRKSNVLGETAITGDPREGFGISQTGDEIYINTSAGMFQVSPGPPRKVLDENLGGQCGASGSGFWGVTLTESFRFRDGKRSAFPGPADVGTLGQCTEDRSGRFWMITSQRRLMWHDDKGWHAPKDEVPPARLAVVVTTPSGDIAYTSPDELVRLNGDRATRIELAPYDIGTITLLEAGPRDIFVGGSNALLRIRGNKVSRLDWRRFPWIVQLRAMMQTARGETWFRKGRGLSRVKTADLDRAFDDPNAPLERTLIDQHGGMNAPQDVFLPGPQMGIGADGRIWQLDRSGVSFIDPAALTRDTQLPPVVVRSIAAGGKTWLDPSNLIFPPGTRSLDIAFTALRQAVPERAQYRYQLEGVDDGWVDAGAKRTASYSNLGPGKYRFRVIAANSDGVWNNQGATLEFEIRPTFFQSWPFYLLCGLAFAGLLWLAYSVRVRAVANRIRSMMAERMEERERIARELHDTLLQSVQALTLRFQLAVDDLPKQEPARPALEQAIDRADQVIAEGRDRVRDLRSLQDKSDIAQIVADIVARQAFDPKVEIAVTTVGTARPLAPLMLDEATYIASEAIFNIRRHAEASKVAIEICYTTGFTLRLTDDGVGIDPAIIAKGGKDGHFGLSGMNERAKKLRGAVTVRGLPEGGTEVMLTIPGSVAYDTGKRGLLSRLRKLF